MYNLSAFCVSVLSEEGCSVALRVRVCESSQLYRNVISSGLLKVHTSVHKQKR